MDRRCRIRVSDNGDWIACGERLPCPIHGKKRIYVASSWRNNLQPFVVAVLRTYDHNVYDFKNPVPDNYGFSWKEIDGGWQAWTPAQYREALKHPIAEAGWRLDIDALRRCDACVLVLPSGRSASWEFGYAMAMGKDAAVFMPAACEPELMYRGADILTTPEELHDWAKSLRLT